MGLIAKSSGGGDFVMAPAGAHPAYCVQVIDLGTQFSKFYEKWTHKVLIGWELHGLDEKDSEGKPLIIWRRYTMSLHENAALRQHLESWRGKDFTKEELEGFALTNILGKPCLVTVAHKDEGDKTYANVSSVTSLPKALGIEKQVHPSLTFDIDEPDMGVFDTFSDKLKETIRSAKEWSRGQHGNGEAAKAADVAEIDDDIPF